LCRNAALQIARDQNLSVTCADLPLTFALASVCHVFGHARLPFDALDIPVTYER
jgi:hypothetical protein